jgi:hypothetical protein
MTNPIVDQPDQQYPSFPKFDWNNLVRQIPFPRQLLLTRDFTYFLSQLCTEKGGPYTFRTLDELERITGHHRRGIQNAIDDLRTYGFVKVVPGQKGWATGFTLLMPQKVTAAQIQKNNAKIMESELKKHPERTHIPTCDDVRDVVPIPVWQICFPGKEHLIKDPKKKLRRPLEDTDPMSPGTQDNELTTKNPNNVPDKGSSAVSSLREVVTVSSGKQEPGQCIGRHHGIERALPARPRRPASRRRRRAAESRRQAQAS